MWFKCTTLKVVSIRGVLVYAYMSYVFMDIGRTVCFIVNIRV